jgi:flagellar motor switch/type III secretory pathway protein FliN
MKALHVWTLAAATVALTVMTACGSSRGLGRRSAPSDDQSVMTVAPSYEKSAQNNDQQATVATAPAEQVDTLQREQFLQKVNDNAQHARFLTSKVKFSVSVGNREMTLTGNLKMKRDDVIRLQLMAFGFVEAGRLEFTQDYVLIVDRINKQYLQVPYKHLDFLRNSGIDFNMLQALFWNELFQPGKGRLTDRQLKKFETQSSSDENIVISLESDKLSYRWLADKANQRVKMANVLYNDRYRGNYQLNWDYDDFKTINRKYFPHQHKVTFTTPDREVKFDMILNYVGSDDDWETRTVLPGKYRQMPVDEILRRFMSL